MAQQINTQNHLSLSITEGRLVRDLLDNKLLDYLNNKNYKTTVYSEASNVANFIANFTNPNVNFSYLYPCGTNTSRSRAYWMRRRLNRVFNNQLLNAYCKFEENIFYPPNPSYLNQLKSDSSKILFTTNAHLANERELITAAHKLNIPTIGFIKSWDNIHKGIHSRTNKVAVWNNINKQELVEIEKENDVISSRLYLGKVQVRIFSESPMQNGFESVSPEIEDLYFATINGLSIGGFE